jgi:hypothetical protein
MRAMAEAELARTVEGENRRFCAYLGVPVGTAGFTECARHLGEVRRLHGERLSREAAGLL